MALVIQNLHKNFGGFVALDRINLTIDDGEFVCLLGPSGCGKTTLLRIIAGLLTADAGKISLDGNNLIDVPAKSRGFGIVFQSYSLFPHMTIADNIGYGLKIRGVSKSDMQQRVKQLLDMVHLSSLGDRYPNQLSGGQQQRVAIARALAVNPALLLLDEPLSALDARVRNDLRREIRDVQQRLGIPTLMVTHDQEEAMTMADKVVCMHGGHIIQAGSPRELYDHPRSRFVAEFMGHSNLLTQQQISQHFPELISTLPAPNSEDDSLFIRPERISLCLDDTPTANSAEICDISFLGSIQRMQVLWRDQTLLVETSSAQPWQRGERVILQIFPKDCFWIAA
ncbi:ABC transporter ATP-binding protein [Pokkaliibacter plantistimulans]|uniref:ABC transporter ATP-binding protein n=1 Tax=Proteobacteria bacterium 228 TaxID=2083153 RepID=A0A2S5KIQ6_9PROT|nr:ABC transporter ATP-binding protein [Pokkaliibacter plantistimulans]PPC74246.1 ABC transporter ATP-binding protein [Pokkaliibacter plantistimulans]